MITIISPTTTMNFDKNINLSTSSSPIFLEDANYLVSLLKELDIDGIKNLMNLSDDLSNLNFNRYLSYSEINNPRLQSILAFDGEVFNCMNTSNFSKENFNFANNHIKILSGLYGILSPFDLIEPYRLEMKSKLKNNLGNDLYKFWKSKITNTILEQLSTHSNPTLVNLASSEYLKCIDLKLLRQHYNFVDIVFKEYNEASDKYKVIGLYSKKARGYMISYMVKNEIDNLDDIRKFNLHGYKFNDDLSNEQTFTFTR